MAKQPFDAKTPDQQGQSDWAIQASTPARVTTIAAHQPLLDIAERHIRVTQSNWDNVLHALEEAYALGMADALKRTPNLALRASVKESMMIALVKRQEGATIEQLSEVTGWSHHTIRDILSNAKEKLGMTITA